MNRQDFIQELLQSKSIRIGEPVDYARFCEIHSAGYSHIPEYQFADLLGISVACLNNIKNKGQRTIILKELIPAFEKQLQAKIREEVLLHFEAGQQITHNQFLDLYSRYSAIYPEMTQVKFGKFLDISESSLFHLRQFGTTILLRSQYSAHTMTEKLMQEELAVPGTRIDYPTFLSLFETAKKKHPSLEHISQYAFANLLGIPKSNFTALKSGKASNSQVLKTYIPPKPIQVANLSFEEIQTIRQDLMQRCHAKPRELCTYERFQELHQGYEHISNRQFAFLLGMGEPSYYGLKSGGKARILKDCFDRESILSSLIEKHNLQAGEKINYAKFMKLYQDCQGLEIYVLADMLELALGTVERLKADSTAYASILQSRVQKPSEITPKKLLAEAQHYVEDLFQTSKIHVGQEIDYEDFLSFYSLCPKIPQHQFARLLGINYFCYQNMRYMHSKTYIHDPKVIDAVALIGKIEKQRFYTQEEISAICQKYHISVADFIQYVLYNGGPSVHVQAHLSALHKHQKLYVGKAQMSNSYFLEIYKDHSSAIRRYVHTLCKNTHTLKDFEDHFSDALLFLLETAGDLEYNFGDYEDDTVIQRMLLSRVRTHLLPSLVEQVSIRSRTKSSDTFYPNRTVQTYNIPDKDTSVENTVISSIMSETEEAEIMR